MAFTLYKEIKYAAGGIPASSLTDFPKLFVIDGDTAIAAECPSGGGIKVTNAAGTVDLPFELVDASTNLTAGDVAFWVKVTFAANGG